MFENFLVFNTLSFVSLYKMSAKVYAYSISLTLSSHLLIVATQNLLNIHQTFDQLCLTNQDCYRENYECDGTYCRCLSTFVEIDGNCFTKIKPGHSPCFRDEQCQAIWPDTKCINTICQCTKGTHMLTRDGIVCIENESCPLGGKETLLRDLNNTVLECHSGQSKFGGCDDQLEMYDCLKEVRNGGHSYCCPNKANACHQPMDAGRVFSQEENEILRVVPWYMQHSKSSHSTLRWYMDKLTMECKLFTYLGSGGNANNFLSKEHCESYCKTTCPLGNAMFRSGADGEMNQFSQRQQMCDPSVGCGDANFKCTIIQKGKAFCCPTIDFICSELGGIAQRKFALPYDQGIYCGTLRTTVQRFYFDKRYSTCLPFEYNGCGGNFNNFQTKEQCNSICAHNGTTKDTFL